MEARVSAANKQGLNAIKSEEGRESGGERGRLPCLLVEVIPEAGKDLKAVRRPGEDRRRVDGEKP